MVFHVIISIELLVFDYKNNKHKVFIKQRQNRLTCGLSDGFFSLIFSQIMENLKHIWVKCAKCYTSDSRLYCKYWSSVGRSNKIVYIFAFPTGKAINANGATLRNSIIKEANAWVSVWIHLQEPFSLKWWNQSSIWVKYVNLLYKWFTCEYHGIPRENPSLTFWSPTPKREKTF